MKINAEVFNCICETEQEVYTNEIIKNIVNAGIRKFDPIADESICLFDIPEWVQRKLKQRKQDSYKWFLAVVKAISDGVGEDFQEFFDGSEECYRDYHFSVYYR